jgi:hypothetical protein
MTLVKPGAKLLGAKGLHWVDAGGSGGREEGSGESSDGQEESDGDHGDGVVRFDPIEVAGYEVAAEPGQG